MGRTNKAKREKKTPSKKTKLKRLNKVLDESFPVAAEVTGKKRKARIKDEAA